MKTDVAAEVAACLKSAPGGDAGTDQVYDRLFTLRNCVAVRLRRIFEDEAARDLVTEAAGRTWRQCADTEGEPQRLWQDLRGSFARIAAEEDRASVRVGPFPHDQAVGLLPTTLLDGTRTVRALAAECRGFCDAPLVTPSDLICPYPQLSLPYYAAVRQWQDTPQAVRVFCNVQQVPVGDFIPASIVLRLRLMTELRGVLRSEWTKCVAIDNEYRSFVERANCVHSELWAAQDAEERSAMMALLQVYLAGGKPALIVGLMGYEADWAFLPADVPKLMDSDYSRPLEFIDRMEALGLPPTFGERRGRLEYFIQEALKDRPHDVAEIVKGGLEYLRKWADVSKRGPPAAPTGHVEGENGPSTQDIDSCQQLAADVRKRPEAYRDAGQWLDKRFSFSACMKRLVEKFRLKRLAGKRGPFKYDWQVDWWRQLRRNGHGRAERRRIVLGKRGRLLDAIDYWLDKRNEIIGEVEAQQVVLVTALLLDPDADRIGEPLTEFLSWSWGDRDDFCFAEHAEAGQLNQLFSGRDSVWIGMSESEQRQWIELVQRAGEFVADRDARQEGVAVDPDARLGGDDSNDKTKADWREVQSRLLRLREQGEPYTSQRDLADRLGCSTPTINKAIKNSPKLTGWMARYAKHSPKAQSLNEVVEDRTPQKGEPDPADVLPPDEVEQAMRELIEEAGPDKRAELNAMDDEQRRQMAKLYRDQQRAQHIEDHAKKGNRILGRRP